MKTNDEMKREAAAVEGVPHWSLFLRFHSNGTTSVTQTGPAVLGRFDAEGNYTSLQKGLRRDHS